MIWTILGHLFSAIVGGGAVFIFVHKKPTQAAAAANTLATAVDAAKADLQAAKAEAKK